MTFIKMRLTDDLKEQLELFRAREIERATKRFNKSKDEEIRESFLTVVTMLEHSTYEQLLTSYIACNKTMFTDVENRRRIIQNEQKRFIESLKEQRLQIDDMLDRVAGKRFRKDLFDADSINDMVQAALNDVRSQLARGSVEGAMDMIERHSGRDWLQ